MISSLSDSDQKDEKQEENKYHAYCDSSLPCELIRIDPAAKADFRALELREKGYNVIDARQTSLKLALSSLGLDRANQELCIKRFMLSIESLDMFNSLFLSGASHTIIT